MGQMPVYEYACTTCGERTEARQSFDDLPLEVCPICGGRLRKLYSPVGIVFKGSGFYSTESRKAAAARDGQADSPKPDKGDKKPAKKEAAAKSSGGSPSSTGASGSKSSDGSA